MIKSENRSNSVFSHDKVSSNIGIYDAAVFSALIRHERCRADREGKAFSLVAFAYEGKPASPFRIKSICKQITKALRTTDEIGWMQDGRIGVLLPATTLEGAHQFSRRACAEDKGLSYQIFIYPDQWISDYSEAPEKKERDGAAGLDLPDTFSIAVPAWKRGLDIVGASLSIIVLWPLFLVVAGYIKLVSPGPALFMQKRVGRGGKLFTFVKFRTMKHGNDSVKHQEHIIRRIRAGESLAKLDDADSRIIPGGKFLRKTCVDELPQLFNVLRGDMSLVGPRPCVTYEAREYLKWHTHRFDVLPGMTGLWQVSGKNKLTITQMIRLDIAYASNMSFLNDLFIILRTIPAIVVMVVESVAKKMDKMKTLNEMTPEMVLVEEPFRKEALS